MVNAESLIFFKEHYAANSFNVDTDSNMLTIMARGFSEHIFQFEIHKCIFSDLERGVSLYNIHLFCIVH